MRCCGERMCEAEQLSLIDGELRLVRWCQACGREESVAVADSQLMLPL